MEVSAVTASPGYLLVTLKNPAGINVGHQVQVPLFMLFFCNGNGFKDEGDLGKALFACSDSKTWIHDGVFVVLSTC